jgi:hypothetical protein
MRFGAFGVVDFVVDVLGALDGCCSLGLLIGIGLDVEPCLRLGQYLAVLVLLQADVFLLRQFLLRVFRSFCN